MTTTVSKKSSTSLLLLVPVSKAGLRLVVLDAKVLLTLLLFLISSVVLCLAACSQTLRFRTRKRVIGVVEREEIAEHSVAFQPAKRIDRLPHFGQNGPPDQQCTHENLRPKCLKHLSAFLLGSSVMRSKVITFV